MNKGWETKTLGDLFDITSSKRVFEADWKTEGVPFYRAREIVKLAKHGFVENELFISEEMFDRYSTKHGIPAEGDIMVTGVGTLGICYVVKRDDRFYFKDGNIIWLKKKANVISRFVEYAFQADCLRSQIDDSVGATVGTFTIIKAKNTRIPVPSLSEQQRIVGVLDQAFEAIATVKANTEKNLKNAHAIFESHVQFVFTKRGVGWGEAALGDVCSFVRGPFGGSLKKSMFAAEGYAVYEQQHAIYNQFNDVRYFIDEAKFKEMKRFELRPGDLIMSCSGTMGRVAVVPEDMERGIINQALLKLTPGPALLNTFLKSWMESEAFQDALREHSGGAAIQNVASVRILKEIKLPLPSLLDQRRIVGELNGLREEVQCLASVYERKLTALGVLRQSLLHQAFSGEL